jgi:hypothetical protein
MTAKIADEGKDIVLVMHSYGGIPATESAHGLAKKDREAAGKKGGIVALLYVAALLVQPVMSLGSTLGAGYGIPDYVKVDVSIHFSLYPLWNPFWPGKRRFRLFFVAEPSLHSVTS